MAGLRQVGTVDCSREMLKRMVKTEVSCPARSISTCPGMPSGPAALLGLVLLGALLSSRGLSIRVFCGASCEVSLVLGRWCCRTEQKSGSVPRVEMGLLC